MTYSFLTERILEKLLSQTTAEQLMLRYQSHSPEEAYAAFEELYRRYSSRVFQYLNKKTRNAADTEDLMQKVFFKIHESKHLYNEKYAFEQWLFVIARTALLDHFRSKGRHQNKMDLLAESKTGEGLQETEGQDLSLGFMERLPENEKELLTLKFIDELSYQEMAQTLGKSEVSLRKTVSRLIGRLKKGEVYE